MPFPLMALPMLAGAGSDVIGGILSATSDRAQQQHNKKRLNELLAMEKKNQFGLDPDERRNLNAQTYNPAANAAADARSRAEQLMSAGGATSGADLVASQKAQAGQNAQSRQQAAQIVNAANIQKKNEQKSELEARLAQKSEMAQRDINKAGVPITNALAAGTQAGVDKVDEDNYQRALAGAQSPVAAASGGNTLAQGVDPALAGISPELLRRMQQMGMLGGNMGLGMGGAASSFGALAAGAV